MKGSWKSQVKRPYFEKIFGDVERPELSRTVGEATVMHSVFENILKGGQVIQGAARFVLVKLPDRSVLYEWFSVNTKLKDLWDFISLLSDCTPENSYLTGTDSGCDQGWGGEVTLKDVREAAKSGDPESRMTICGDRMVFYVKWRA